MSFERLPNRKYRKLVNKYFSNGEKDLREMRMMNLDNDYYGGECPSRRIMKDLGKESEAISAKVLEEFNAKFTYIKRDDVEFYALDNPSSCTQYFNKQDKNSRVGRYRDACFYDSDGQHVYGSEGSFISDNEGSHIADLAYVMMTYHDYYSPHIFVGTVGDIIVQLPIELTNSTKKFYYTMHEYSVSNIPDCHIATIHFYERT